MSEYQYYEFQAIDRPLTLKEQATLRKYSSRATITSRRFAVEYSWGDFKGNAAVWMGKYFDAFLYLANWGTHELMLRLPGHVLPLKTAKRYCPGGFASARATGDFVVLSVRSDDEEGEWADEDDGTLASLLSVRADLASGDVRALYIAWLGCVQAGERKDDEPEPPCPPGLGNLSPSLEAFAAFLRIDDDLIAAAATVSPNQGAIVGAALETWVAALPESEKTSLLVRLVGGDDARIRSELLRRYRESPCPRAPAVGRARTVGELVAAAESRAKKPRSREAERTAREEAQRNANVKRRRRK